MSAQSIAARPIPISGQYMTVIVDPKECTDAGLFDVTKKDTHTYWLMGATHRTEARNKLAAAHPNQEVFKHYNAMIYVGKNLSC